MARKLGKAPKKRPPPASKPAVQEAPPQKQPAVGNTWGLVLIIMLIAVTGVMEFPSFIILAAGLPPALAAAMVDTYPGRHTSYCVMATNLAGIAPVLSALWVGGNNIAVAMLLLSDVYVWLGMYSAAALGWALIWIYSIACEFVLALMSGSRVRKLSAAQARLVAEWGSEVIADEAG